MITVRLTGRLTAAPEQKVMQNGKELCTFSVAVRRRFGKDENGNAICDFPNCVAYGQLSVFICRYFGKGDMIDISGVLQSRKYTDRDGKNRTVWEITAENAEFCGGKNEGARRDENTVSTTSESEKPVTFEALPNESDLPF